MKKIMSLLLVAAMICTLFVGISFAAETPAVIEIDPKAPASVTDGSAGDKNWVTGDGAYGLHVGGASATYKVNVTVAGTYSLAMKYKSEYRVAKLDVTVNGTKLVDSATNEFAKVSAWTDQELCKVDLVAGENTITIANFGEKAVFINALSLTLISAAETVNPTVIEIDPKAPASVTDGSAGDKNWVTGDGAYGLHIGGASATYKVNVTTAGTYSLAMSYKSEYRVAKLDVTINGTKLVDSASTEFAKVSAWTNQELCKVELAAGENTITLANFGEKAVFINALSLTCISASEPETPEVPAVIEIDPRTASSATNGANGEANWSTGDGAYGIHINGASATYKVNVTTAGTYSLVMNYKSEYRVAKLDVTVNGTKLVDSAATEFAKVSAWTDQELCKMDLVAGENTITLANFGEKAVFIKLLSLTFVSATEPEAPTAMEIDPKAPASVTDGSAGDKNWVTGDGAYGLHVGGASATYKVNVTTAGTYSLVMNYKSEYRVAKLDVTVNGTKVVDSGATEFAKVSAWTDQELCKVDLVAGENTITLANFGEKAVFIKLLSLTFVSAAEPETPTAEPITIPVNNPQVAVGDQFEKTFEITVAGTYQINLRVGKGYGSKHQVGVSVDGSASKDYTIVKDDNRTVFDNILPDTFVLAAGTHTITITNTADKNLNFESIILTLVSEGDVTPPEAECTHTNTKVDGAVDATCGADGHTGKTVCADCGHVVSEGEAIPATGEHTYVDYVCSVCGAKDPNKPLPEGSIVLMGSEATLGDWTYGDFNYGWANINHQSVNPEKHPDECGKVTFTFEAESAGTYNLILDYRKQWGGRVSNVEGFVLAINAKVNGGDPFPILIDRTDDNFVETVGISVYLEEGWNTIELYCGEFYDGVEHKFDHWVNIRTLILEAVELEAPGTTPDATEPDATEPDATEPDATEPPATNPETGDFTSAVVAMMAVSAMGLAVVLGKKRT